MSGGITSSTAKISMKRRALVKSVLKAAPSGKTYVLKSCNIAPSGMIKATALIAKKDMETSLTSPSMALVLNNHNKVIISMIQDPEVTQLLVQRLLTKL